MGFRFISCENCKVFVWRILFCVALVIGVSSIREFMKNVLLLENWSRKEGRQTHLVVPASEVANTAYERGM